MSSAFVKELNGENFDKEISASSVPVLVDFWASWCGPCRMLAPVVEQVAEELGDAAKVCKVNIDDCPDVAAKFDIMSIPTLIVFKNGVPAGKMVGVQSKSAILKALGK